jgi:5-methylcytosine-specific restriction enzyme subunit McrC
MEEEDELRERPGGFPQADLYQMLAYCTALRLPEGHLIYARGEAQASSYYLPSWPP